MTRPIRIEGETVAGEIVTAFVLTHGGDPSTELAERGWSLIGPVAAFTPADSDEVIIRVRVAADLGAGERHTTWTAGHAPEAVPAGVVPIQVQRVAAYAVVVRDADVLLTQLSHRVRGVPGRWTLPGGGVEPGEDPGTGLRREVWEETGQHLGSVQLIDLLTAHWVGQGPDGVWEDYQVVRLVYAASVPEPEPLVVHDVGGTTAQAAWVPAQGVLAGRASTLAWHRWPGWLSHGSGRTKPTPR
ncbi:MAG TPA: NUDIX domain-containing protein [Tetrasphaera sp.]|uniref:NUDIX hydrolase n=1 Tax=Nostocoides sp. TaxID=1917966 RepID=UPI002C4BDE65|nr:NUDIX domain-containing protein [Tetrasphaera sp.]HNQ07896.1 NUDIX domain-containing protein [Tetrasphaera sp.]